jgi:Protein of unknown function (DUF3455)
MHTLRLVPFVLIASLTDCGVVPAPEAAIPTALQPSAAEKRLVTYRARGVQIYECAAAADGAAPKWNFVAPEAELFDATTGAAAGTHGAGPFWQARDGSKVVGKVKERADAPVAGAIPWLLLSTTPAAGAGQFAAVTSVQRIHTAGGVAPTGGCAEKSDVGKRSSVPYTADYVFFAPA